jgi:hypothetical protein
VYDARRRELPRLRRFGRLVAVSWSSDERFAAVARQRRVLIVGSRGTVVLPLHARDLGWTRDLR